MLRGFDPIDIARNVSGRHGEVRSRCATEVCHDAVEHAVGDEHHLGLHEVVANDLRLAAQLGREGGLERIEPVGLERASGRHDLHEADVLAPVDLAEALHADEIVVAILPVHVLLEIEAVACGRVDDHSREAEVAEGCWKLRGLCNAHDDLVAAAPWHDGHGVRVVCDTQHVVGDRFRPRWRTWDVRRTTFLRIFASTLFPLLADENICFHAVPVISGMFFIRRATFR